MLSHRKSTYISIRVKDIPHSMSPLLERGPGEICEHVNKDTEIIHSSNIRNSQGLETAQISITSKWDKYIMHDTSLKCNVKTTTKTN